MLAAEFGVGQAVWTMFWFFIFFLWIMLVFQVVVDIFRSTDLSGVMKALWVLFVFLTPYLGVFVYLIARGSKMGERQMALAKQQEVQGHHERTHESAAHSRAQTGEHGVLHELALEYRPHHTPASCAGPLAYSSASLVSSSMAPRGPAAHRVPSRRRTMVSQVRGSVPESCVTYREVTSRVR